MNLFRLFTRKLFFLLKVSHRTILTLQFWTNWERLKDWKIYFSRASIAESWLKWISTKTNTFAVVVNLNLIKLNSDNWNDTNWIWVRDDYCASAAVDSGMRWWSFIAGNKTRIFSEIKIVIAFNLIRANYFSFRDQS